MKTLIAYFSATGTTGNMAAGAARDLQADLFEIRPQKPYTEGDLRWSNPLSRCNREKFGGRAVPVEKLPDRLQDYDLVLLGFPIWYGGAPNVVNTFCGQLDWSRKRVAVFATSGGSGIGKSGQKLQKHMKGCVLLDAKLVHSAAELASWARGLQDS